MTLESEVTILINSIGKTLTLRKVTEGAYNTATGAVDGQSTADTTLKGMLLNFKLREFDGQLILQGDVKIVIRASDGVVPEVQDIVLDGSVEYRLIDVRQIEEADDDVVYICQGRK